MINKKVKPSAVNHPVQSPLMGEHLIRLGRLRAYQKSRGWNDSELARQCGRSPQQVRSWSTTRLIGEKLARELEEALKLPRFYLDEREFVPLGRAAGVSTPAPADTSVNNEASTRPVLQWDEFDAMLALDNSKIKKSVQRLESYAVASKRAKFVQMNDDSMEPDFMRGDHVLLDPAELPRAGDVVLVRLPNGEHFVRVFKPRTAYVFEAVAANDHYHPLSSVADAVVVVAVMVEHRKYRRRTT